MAVSATDVQKAYLAYFGRPADPVGLAYWQTQTLETMKAGFAASTEYTTMYSGMTNAQIVAQVYQNVLGREAEYNGLMYWAGEMTAGRQTLITVADTIQAAALSGADGADKTTVSNRITYAAAFTAAIDTTAEVVGYSGTTAATAARTAVAAVTTNASLTTAQTNLAGSVSTVVGSGSTSTGQTYTLTTSADTITGTSGNDQINAYIDAAAATDTFTGADTIDGGSGTDVMNITTDGNGAGALPGATVSNVETFKIRETGGTAGVYDFGAITGETSVYNNKSTDQVTVNNLAAGTAVYVVGDGTTTNGVTIFTMAAATDAVTLNIDGGVTAGNITRNATGAATITVNSTGAANTIGTLDVDTAALVAGLTINATTNLTGSLAADYAASSKLTVSGGATKVDLSGAALSANFSEVNASGLTAGGVLVQVDQTDTTVDTKFVGGTGADTLDVGKVVYNSTTLTAAGGDGTDVLKMSDQAALTSTTAKYISGFETLSLYDDNDAALDTFDASLLTGITSIKLAADSAGDGYTISNMSATQAAAVTISGTQAVTPTFSVTGATTVAQLDTLSITIDDGAAAVNTITLANITAAGVETVNLALTDNLTLSTSTGLTAFTKIAATGAGALSLTVGAFAQNVNASIDASALTGTVTIDASGGTTNGLSLKGSSTKANTITGTNQDDVIVGGTGVDTVKNTNNAATDADTLDFVSDSSADIIEFSSVLGKTTIANFDVATTTTTEDLVNVSEDTVDGGEVQVTAAAAQGALTDDRTYVIEQAIGTAAALATGGTATLATADFTATTLTNVAAYLSERFTDAAGDGDDVVFIVNNGTNSYAYALNGSNGATSIAATELSLIGVFTGVILNAGDVYQTV